MHKIYTALSTTVDILAEPYAPDVISNFDSQLVYGEAFEADEVHGEWMFGRSLHDGYKGAVRRSLMQPQTTQQTHFVTVALTALYATPDFKTRPVMLLPFLSRLTVNEEKRENAFVRVDKRGWVFEAHIARMGQTLQDNTLDIAMLLRSSPYLYGGRSALGVDCSGLVQLALMARGIACPRDTRDQIHIGKQVEGKAALQRGDLVFFAGHVGIMMDATNILNATARTMRVEIEKLSDLETIYGGITGIRRV